MFISIVFFLGSDKLFSCVFAEFLLFSLKEWITECVAWEFLLLLHSSHGSSCYSCTSFRVHASSFVPVTIISTI